MAERFAQLREVFNLFDKNKDGMCMRLGAVSVLSSHVRPRCFLVALYHAMPRLFGLLDAGTPFLHFE
jgi:hypothetical protein